MVCTIQHICDHNLGCGSKCQEAKDNVKIFSLSTVKSLLSPVSLLQPCLFAHTSLHLSPLIVSHAHTFGIAYIDIILESACTQLTSLHLSQISPQYLSVHVQAADVRNMFVSLIMIPEVFYAKHIMHALLILNLGLPWETNNYDFYKTNDLLPRYSRELNANQAAGQEYLRR